MWAYCIEVFGGRSSASVDVLEKPRETEAFFVLGQGLAIERPLVSLHDPRHCCIKVVRQSFRRNRSAESVTLTPVRLALGKLPLPRAIADPASAPPGGAETAGHGFARLAQLRELSDDAALRR